ncbi:MAG: BON domain-containing protein [Thermodesulfobacteriota bacterium]
MRYLALALLFLSALPVLPGCAIYKTAVDERSVGTIVRDETISATLQARFLEDKTVSYLNISPLSYEGHVYLVGEYASNAERDRAVALARETDGVREVTTFLLPRKIGDACGTTDNLEKRAMVTKALIEDQDIWSTNVNVEVVQCRVVLLGIVGSQAEIARAVAHAKSVPGVREVKSFLKVRARN